MSDYSAVAPPSNFQTPAYAAALERAKQIAAKISPAAKNNQDAPKKRSLDDDSEPEAKKIATDPLSSLRGSTDSGRSSASSGLGAIGRSGESGSSKPPVEDPAANTNDAVNRAKQLVQSLVNQNVKGSDSSSGSSGLPGFLEIMIPGPKVGLIIGKGGETIKQLQEKSGAKMVIIQDGPGQEREKPLRITGDPQKVEHAKELVYELIAEKEMQMFQRGGGRGGFGGDGGESAEVVVPYSAVGVVIGKGGEMIKKLQQECGCKIKFVNLNDENQDDRTCLITGNQSNVEEARQRIHDLIDGLDGGKKRGNGFRTNEFGSWKNNNDGRIEFSYTVPVNKCGIIIGKGGETIKQINATTGAHCELDRKNGTESEKYFIIRGMPDQVEHAKRIFGEKLGGGPMGQNMYSGQTAMGYNAGWNNTYQGWPAQPGADMTGATQQSVQINPQTGQPDYSTQWAEYYRSLGMHKEAEMIEQQAKQQMPQPKDMNQQQAAMAGQQQMQPQQAQQQQSAPQNGSQADYSAQWAEYYRSIGKIKEAEAIEAQMKTGKAGAPGNPQASQAQMQPAMQNPGANPAAPQNPFPQAYGGYQTMNPAAPTSNYYTGNAPAPQPQGQQNPSYPQGAYQNYQYAQPNSEN